jgi:hypothetical protein
MHSWRLLRRALPLTLVLVLLGTVLVTNARADRVDVAVAKPAVVHEQDVPRARAAAKQPTSTRTSGPAVVAELPETTVRTFSLIGVTWDPDTRSADLAVDVKWRLDGRWSSWTPLDLEKVSSNIFTSPEIATVGLSQQKLDERDVQAEVAMLPLATNARAKMQGVHDGFVKLFARRGGGVVLGGVVVSPRASELIHGISLAVSASLTVDQVADAFTVYPSLSGSVAEVARRRHRA